MSSVICGQCNNKITTDNYASCYSCKHNYHFFHAAHSQRAHIIICKVTKNEFGNVIIANRAA